MPLGIKRIRVSLAFRKKDRSCCANVPVVLRDEGLPTLGLDCLYTSRPEYRFGVIDHHQINGVSLLAVLQALGLSGEEYDG